MLVIFTPTANYPYSSVHWIVPTIAGGSLSMCMLLIFVSYLNYIVDTYLMYAASAIAANTIVRSACGAAAPLFTRQMFSALGVGGGGSLVGGVAALLAVIPFMFYKFGKQIRIRSKFAPTKAKQELRQQDEEANPTDLAVQSPSDDDTSTVVSSSEEESDVLETAEETKEKRNTDGHGNSVESETSEKKVHE